MVQIENSKKKSPPSLREILPGIFAFPPNPDSFGGISYLVKSQSGNFMVDVPEYFHRHLEFIESAGVPDFIFLTHRDDVAEAVSFRKKFGSKLIIHESEESAIGEADIIFGRNYILSSAEIIHTPGHSPGSSTLYLREGQVMFTGDHITANRGMPVAEEFSWTYNFGLQLESAWKLLDFEFEYILAGHGGRWLIPNARDRLRQFLENHG